MFLSSSLQAQQSLKGTIYEAGSEETLPFVDIYLIGTAQGTQSDFDGTFALALANEVDSVGVAMIGYQKQEFAIKDIQDFNNFVVKLRPKSLNLVTATVTATRKRVDKDTLAIRLWRKIVAKRKLHQLENAKTYQYQDYEKIQFSLFDLKDKFKNRKMFQKRWSFVLDNIQQTATGEEYLPCLIKETVRDVYYKDKKQKKIVVADQFSGIENQSASEFVNVQFENINPYDNLIILAGKSFIGPFGSNGNASYRYFITDTLQENGEQYYVMDFIGRREQDFTFIGTATIHAKSCAIAAIDLEISQNINLNFLVEYQTQQTYRLLPDSLWAKQTEQTQGIIATTKNKSPIKIKINKSSSRSNIQVNSTISDEVMQGETEEWTKGADQLRPSYWETARHTSLSRQEQQVYFMVDSLKNTPRYKFMEWIGYAAASGYLRTGYLEWGRVPKIVSWNEVEGIRPKLRFRTTNKFSKTIQLQAFAAYGTKDKLVKYGAAMRLHLPTGNNRWHLLTGHYNHDYQILGQESLLYSHDNIILSLLRTSPLRYLMRIKEAQIEYTKEWIKGFSSSLTVQHRKFIAVPNVFDFTKLECSTVLPHFATAEVKLGLHWGPKEQFFIGGGGFYRFSMNSPLPIVDFEYTAAAKGIAQSDYNYHKFDLKIRHRLNSVLGYTKYQISGSKVLGEAPFPLLNVHLGNQSYVYGKFAYNLMQEFEFVSDENVAIWVDHHFDGLLLNGIPLIKKLQWRTFVSFKGLWGRVSKRNMALLDFPSHLSAPKFYAEVGFGVENIFKILRIDVLWRLTQRNAPNTRKWGIVLAIQPKF